MSYLRIRTEIAKHAGIFYRSKKAEGSRALGQKAGVRRERRFICGCGVGKVMFSSFLTLRTHVTSTTLTAGARLVARTLRTMAASGKFDGVVVGVWEGGQVCGREEIA